MSIHDLSDAELLSVIATQEAELQFNQFPVALAHEIGAALADKARATQAPVVVDITRMGQVLFHTAFEGATPDNAEWVLRKNRVVNRFHHASLYMGAFCRENGFTLGEKFFLPEATHAPHGGAFPIILRDTGVIGTVTVSGLPQRADHEMVTDVLAQFM